MKKNKYKEDNMDKFGKKYFLTNETATEQFLLFSKPKKIIKEIIEYHDKRKEYETLFYKTEWKRFIGSKKVLDMGCGEGTFLKYAPENIEAYGIDIDRKRIKELKKNKLNVKVSKIDKIPYKNEYFDGIYCSHVIEHVNDVFLLIKEIKRVLKRGGKLVIKTPNFATTYSSFYDDPTHKNPFTIVGLYRLLAMHGFKDIKIEYGTYYRPYTDVIYSLFSVLFYFPKIRFFIERRYADIRKYEIIISAKK
jgi:2-polyprenyl-3-methyl-5-hydroxy-6-metoxy-1,4-benzoquinol methylase